MKLADVKKALRNGKYACPGGYPMFFVSSDGLVLSFEAVRNHWRDVCEAHIVAGWCHNGWHIDAVDINWEDAELYCDATCERIESAYADT